MTQSVVDFALKDVHEFQISEEVKSHGILHLFNDDESIKFVSILSKMMTTHFVIIILFTIAHILLVVPSNLLTVIVIIRNKELWTPGNIVLSINGLAQCIGSAIYLVSRSLTMHSFFLLPSHNNYKESVYTVGWWTYSLMMRTGNNR